MTLKFWSSSVHLPRAKITGVGGHAWFYLALGRDFKGSVQSRLYKLSHSQLHFTELHSQPLFWLLKSSRTLPPDRVLLCSPDWLGSYLLSLWQFWVTLTTCRFSLVQNRWADSRVQFKPASSAIRNNQMLTFGFFFFTPPLLFWDRGWCSSCRP